MNTSGYKSDFIKNKTCPYCQSKIKQGADFIVCSYCGSPHHKECWEENTGCTTYGCFNNPNTEEKVEINSDDVGDETVESIRESILESTRQPVIQNFIKCPNCKSDIEESSTYCKYCGFNLKENKSEAKDEFEKEYKKRYKEKHNITRKRLLITIGSFIILISVLSFLFYTTVTRLNAYFSSDEYKIENTVYNWKDAWENKDIEKMKSYMTEDYQYYGKDGKKMDYAERVSRLEASFKNYKNISISYEDYKMINDSSTTDIDKRVEFKESYTGDKFHESGTKTLRLYKAAENSDWKIYREIFDP